MPLTKQNVDKCDYVKKKKASTTKPFYRNLKFKLKTRGRYLHMYNQ